MNRAALCAHRWAYALTSRADQWMHFHRFEARFVCDLFDRVQGAPRVVIRSYRAQPPHMATRSYLRHPSQREETANG